MKFDDRTDAGRRLAVATQHLRGRDVVVCGLPRGGVPVAYQVALDLKAPLDVIVVRKLGFPGQPELAMGAVGESGARSVNEGIVAWAGLTAGELAEIEEQAAAEVRRAAETFRKGLDPVPRAGRTVVIVDDGIATGSTALAACQVARVEGAASVVLAAPVAPAGWTITLGEAADEYICVETPRGMKSVGHWYRDFTATHDSEVVNCLAESMQWRN